MKNRFNLKENYCFLLAPCITATVLITAFVIGKVFPFGTNTVIYFDMAQRFIPNLYHIWDAMHSSDTALWFNWLSGLGVNDTADASFSFFWFVLAVLPRRLIGKAMSLYVVMFFSMSAFSACLFLRVTEKTNPLITTMLSVCYAFCGFSVMYYTNMWQDSVFLFPLLMLSLVYLFKSGKGLPYILLVFLNLQCNYYVFALTLMYLFFSGYLYIRLVVERENRRTRCRTFAISTLAGGLLSGFSLVPKLVQTFSSGRFVEKTGFNFSSLIKQYIEIAGTSKCEYPEKIAMLFATALPFAIVIVGFLKNKNKEKKDVFFILNIALLAMLIVFEGTNLLMHMGDYKYFPMRMGFALSFAFVWAAGYYSKYISFKIPYNNKSRGKLVATFCINIASMLIFAGFTYALMKYMDSKFSWEFSIMFAYPFLVILYALFIVFSGKWLDYRASIGGLLAEILVLSMMYIPYWNTDFNKQEQSPAYIEESQTLARKLSIEQSKTDRIKTIGTTLNCNYGTVIGRATVSDWTHMIPTNVQSSLMALGYSGEYTRLHDSGGTALTDAVFGITKVLSVKDESPALYEKIDKKKGYRYYDCKYTIPYGIVTSKSVLDIDIENGDWISLNNALYSSLSGDDEAIVTQAELTLVEKGENSEKYTFSARDNSVAYFRLRGAKKVRVLINGEEVRIPSVDREKYKKYPGRFNRNLICLGEFPQGEKVEMELIFEDGKYEDKSDFGTSGLPTDEKNQNFSVQIGYLDLNKLGSLCDMYRAQDNQITAKNYELTANASSVSDDKVLLLPLQYNGCWSASVNNQDTEVECVAGLITAIELNEGDNNIEMRFTPAGFKAGLITSVAGLLIFAVYLITQKKGRQRSVFSNLLYNLYSIAFIAGVALIYIIPMGITIIKIII